MGNRRGSAPAKFYGKEQSQLKQFLFRLFEDGCPPEEALQAVRSRFDADDLLRARAMSARSEASTAKDVRGPRGKG